MASQFFDLSMDVYVPGRWSLAEPRRLDGQPIEDIWQFIEGREVEDPGPLYVPLFQAGRPLDLEFAGAGQAPVVSERVAKVFLDMAPHDVQLFPVEVEGQPGSYFLLNVTRTVRCIDDAACEEVRLWTSGDGRPDRVGEYRVVAGLRIDPSKVNTARVFRLWGWTVPLIVEASIKDALARTGIVGGRFDAV
ncbi:imm11 family protein [Archangium primigenium]|uniref:imm11 family protein n=1 Tax=[Archangium] primigenium TaxID=2792470 RepID=UPI00195EABD0|nr:DUF1629 domain-containing protein [Archangium primigenium]MBM7112808.1 hypothetical protein [Archangium primigenium]